MRLWWKYFWGVSFPRITPTASSSSNSTSGMSMSLIRTSFGETNFAASLGITWGFVHTNPPFNNTTRPIECKYLRARLNWSSPISWEWVEKSWEIGSIHSDSLMVWMASNIFLYTSGTRQVWWAKIWLHTSSMDSSRSFTPFDEKEETRKSWLWRGRLVYLSFQVEMISEEREELKCLSSRSPTISTLHLGGVLKDVVESEDVGSDELRKLSQYESCSSCFSRDTLKSKHTT